MTAAGGPRGSSKHDGTLDYEADAEAEEGATCTRGTCRMDPIAVGGVDLAATSVGAGAPVAQPWHGQRSANAETPNGEQEKRHPIWLKDGQTRQPCPGPAEEEVPAMTNAHEAGSAEGSG
jgi:hypothetical protein